MRARQIEDGAFPEYPNEDLLIRHHFATLVLDFISAATEIFPDIDLLDFFIVLAVSSAGRRRLSSDMALLYRVAFESPAGYAAEQQPVSRSTISRFLNLPLETTRRRVEMLVERNIFGERPSGVVMGDVELALGGNFEKMRRLNGDLLARLHNRLAAEKIELPGAGFIATSDGVRLDRARDEWLVALAVLSNNPIALFLSALFNADETVELDIVDRLIFLFIAHHNAGRPRGSGQCVSELHGVPNRLGRGVSRKEIVGSLRMPAETARRRIARLIALGLVGEQEDGLALPADLGSRFRVAHIGRRNSEAVRRMFSRLQELIDYRNAIARSPG